MIASEDVRRVTFERSMRGYRCEDVDDYLKQVADSMDALGAENEELQKKLVVLAQRIDQYRAEEDTLRTTMINAQRLGENVIKEAKQKAAEIIRAANIKAEDREQHARDEVELAQQELVTIKRETDSFKKSLMEMYRKHIELLSKIPEFPEGGDDGYGDDGYDDAPAPPPAAEPEPQPAPADPAPAYTEPAPQPEAQDFEEEQDYYEADEAPAPQPAPEKKVDTVEFAFAPKPAEPEDQRQADEPLPAFKDVSGLYDEPAAPSKKSTGRGRGTSKAKSARKPKTPPKPADDLPAALDSFTGVDYDD